MKLLTRQMFVNVVSAKEHKSIHSEWCVSRRCAYSRILLRRFQRGNLQTFQGFSDKQTGDSAQDCGSGFEQQMEYSSP